MIQPPPQFIDGERAILGGLLIDNSRAHEVIEELSPADFYREGHRYIFEAFVALLEREVPLDWVSLTEELKGAGKLEAVGGPAYLAELIDAIPSASNIQHYVTAVKQKAVLRKIISSASEIKSLCGNGGDFQEILQQTEELALAAASTKAHQKDGKSSELRPLKSVIWGCVDEIEEVWNNKKHPGIYSGFKELDNLTMGFHRGDLIVVCGRPGHGKTAFSWACSVSAAQDSQNVGLFSIEMSKEQVGQRGLSREGALNLRKLRGGEIDREIMDKLVTAAGNLSALPIYLNDPSTLSPAQIRFRVRSLALRHKVTLDLIVIDYLQLMNPGRRIESREQQVAVISRELKQAAKDLNCPIVILAQLNRELEKRPDKRPKLSDLRESGAIEQDADLVIGLYQPYLYTGKDEDRGKAEALILKQRNGPIGSIELEWVPETASYWNKRRGFSHDENI